MISFCTNLAPVGRINPPAGPSSRYYKIRFSLSFVKRAVSFWTTLSSAFLPPHNPTRQVDFKVRIWYYGSGYKVYIMSSHSKLLLGAMYGKRSG